MEYKEFIGGRMPRYDFKCQKCGKAFEVAGSYEVVSQIHKCPDCKSSKTKRVFSPIGFILKGKGFYKTGDD